jgi:DNA polymerase III alpha subunit
VTQFDMGPVEELGLVKIDLLSQRSLGVLQDAVAAVAAHTGAAPPVDDRELILADEPTRSLIREGRTMGCFYVESPAMRSLLKKLRTETFEELTAASSVIRPGVAESGMMQEYIRRHHIARAGRTGGRSNRGTDRNARLVPAFPTAEVLRETHGVMIYQEDVLRVAHALAGMSLGQADAAPLDERELRSPGRWRRCATASSRAAARAGRAGVAAETWRQIESFAGYAFCKAHSASYACSRCRSPISRRTTGGVHGRVISNQGASTRPPTSRSRAGWACASCCPT